MKLWVDILPTPNLAAMERAAREQESRSNLWSLLASTFDGCDEHFANAVRNLSVHLEKSDGACERYSLISRRYSVWSLISRYLDHHFCEAIAACDDSYVRQLLYGLQLSKMGAHGPQWESIPEPPALRSHSPVRLERLLSSTSTDRNAKHKALPVLARRVSRRSTYRHLPQPRSQSQTQEVNLRAWDRNLRAVIRRLYDWDTQPDQWRVVIATLDTTRTLVSVLVCLCRRMEENELATAHEASAPGRVLSKPFCELCWRPTMHYAGEHPAYVPPGAKKRFSSKRFCANHDSRNPTSEYRKDLPYKGAFERELMAQRGAATSKYVLRFQLPKGASHEARRRAAYDLVHSRLRAVHSGRDGRLGLREEVFVRIRSGMTQAAIAREMGISRQAVSKAWKNLKTLRSTFEGE